MRQITYKAMNSSDAVASISSRVEQACFTRMMTMGGSGGQICILDISTYNAGNEQQNINSLICEYDANGNRFGIINITKI
ncbi:MAG: hypothetical protein R6W75_12800, partial [Smithellaceae bacterium]